MDWNKTKRLDLQSPLGGSRIKLTGDMQDLLDYIAMGQRAAKQDPDIMRALRNIEYWNKVLETVT